jgi:lysophospholipase L1-like esterase
MPQLIIKRMLTAGTALVLMICFLEFGLRCYEIAFHHPPIRTFVMPDREFGYVLRPNTAGVMTKTPQLQPVHVSIDAEGHRHTGGSSGIETPRWVCLGDSFIFGYHNGDNETIPSYLSQLFPTFRVINAGVPGYTTYQIYLRYAREIRQPENRVFLLSFGGNDVGHYFRSRWTPDYIPHRALGSMEPFQRSRVFGLVFNFIYRRFGGLGTGSQDVSRLLSRAAQRPFDPRDTAPLFANIRRRVADMGRLSRQYGKMTFVLPYPNVVEGEWPPKDLALMAPILRIMPVNPDQYRDLVRTFNRTLREECSISGLHFVDVNPRLNKSQAEHHFTDGSHLTAEGNALVAEAVAQAYHDGNPASKGSVAAAPTGSFSR